MNIPLTEDVIGEIRRVGISVAAWNVERTNLSMSDSQEWYNVIAFPTEESVHGSLRCTVNSKVLT